MLSDLPAQLARARKNAGSTHKEIERPLNIKQSAIASYESGRSRPTYENLVKLADFYNVTCDWLLGAKCAAEAERQEREEINKAFGGSICGFVNDVLQNQKTSPRLIKALM